MEILGVIFVGSSSDRRTEMASFAERVLGLSRTQIDGVEADLFDLPDGTRFAVASAGGMGATARSIGFLVGDIDSAVDELRRAGAETDDEIAENADYRYVHFRAPDGALYELVQRRGG
jgi:glyoxylase I family protein